MERRIHLEKKRIFALLVVFFVLYSILPAQRAYGAESYDFQGLPGTVETAQGVKDYNGLKLVEPADITVLETTDNENGYFLNQINDEIDGTAGRIEFAFCMTSGMNQIGEPGNWNFTSMNLDPDPSATPGMNPDKKTQVNIYRMEDGDSYTGKDWAKDKKPVVNYDLGNLKIDDAKTYANITNGDGTGRITLYTTEVLSSGDYILEFGVETCGNNPGKILGVPVAFQFTVKGVYTFEEAIEAAQELLSSAVIGNEAGQYRAEEKKTALEECLKDAQDLQNPSEEQKKEMASKLSDAIEALEQSRVVDVRVDSISGIGTSVSVGSSGTAQATLSTNPNDKSGYRKAIWSASENIEIDPDTGEWTALWAGNAEITAKSKWQSDNPSSIPDSAGGTAASKTVNFTITSDGDCFSIGIPKGTPEDEDKGMLQTVMEKAQAGHPQEIDKLKIFTARGASLEKADFDYIRGEFPNLKELDLTKASVESLPDGACKGMAELETVKLPDRLSKISPNAFRDCTALSNVEISSGVTFIGDSAFSGCTSLNGKMITIHAVTPPECSEYPGCFEGVEIKGIKVPYGCKDAYAKHKYWKKFVIEADTQEEKMTVTVSETGGLQTAAQDALGGRSDSQIDTLVIKTSGDAVLNYAADIPYLQDNFLNATTLDLSDAVLEDQRLKSGTFEGRVNLKKVRLHEDTTNIAGEAFYGCRNLSDIILPAGLEKIGDRAFGGCDILGSSLILDAVKPPEANGTSFPDCVKTFIVPPQSVSTYKSTDEPFWRTYNIISQVALSLSSKSISLEASAKATLTANVTVYNNNLDTVTWTSSNPRVASVSPERGKTTTVTAEKAGTATITAKAANGYVTAACTVTVRDMAAPASVKASAPAYNKIKVSWSGVSGAQGYIVYRSTKRSSGYAQIRTLSSSDRSYTDTGRKTGTTYYYKVRAYKTVSGTRHLGAYSAVANAKPALAKAKKVKAKRAGKQKIRVSWKRVTGATGYKVYRSTKKNKGFKAVKTIKKAKTVKYTTKKMKKGKRYYFKVRAYRNVGGKKVYSAYSSRVSCKAR